MTACGRELIDAYDVSCVAQQGGRGGKSGIVGQEVQHSGFASQLGEQMEGTVVSVEKTPFGGAAEISVGRPYVSGLRMLCRRATLTDPHREMTVAVCRQPSDEWTLVEPIFEPLPR